MAEILHNYSFLILLLSIIFSFIRVRKILVISTIFIGIIVAIIQKNIEPIGIIFPLILFLSSYVFAQKTTNNTIKFVMFCIIFILVALLSIHKLPGFNNVLLISGVKTSPQASPFELWANYDKILVASILLAAFYKPDLSFNIFIKMLNKNIHIILIFISMIIVLALTFGMIQFSPKIVNFLHIWIILNLVTVIAEESFFRLFFLNNLLEFANTKKLQFVALTASSIVFSAVHCCGNLYYVVLAFIASIFYGLLYINSGNRIEYSIIGHFSLNLIHILFFTYPWISIT